MNINECVKAFWLDKEDAKKLWSKETDLIIKPKMYRFIINKNYLLIDDKFCYGVISFFHKPERVLPDVFNTLRSRHGITNVDKIGRWRSGNKTVFAYDFEFVDRFEKPIKIFMTNSVGDKDFIAIEDITLG